MLNVMSESLKPIEDTNLKEQIEVQLRDAILNGAFKLGEHLVESVIADSLQVSRGPVREALSSLEREGIITNIPRRGYFVIKFTPKDIEEIYGLRLVLEIGALQRSIERLTTADIDNMQEIVAALGRKSSTNWDQAHVINLDLAFHEFICREADNDRLFAVWNQTRLQTWLLIGLTAQTHYDEPRVSQQFHQDILDAIRKNDLPRAEQYLREHILDAEQRALQALKEQLIDPQD